MGPANARHAKKEATANDAPPNPERFQKAPQTMGWHQKIRQNRIKTVIQKIQKQSGPIKETLGPNEPEKIPRNN